MPRDKKTRALTIYLIKNDIRDPRLILPEIDTLTRHQIRNIGQLFVRPSRPHPPTWATLFDGVIDHRRLQSFSSSTAAVLLIERDGRIFALTFGVGRHLLDAGCYEERFGLLVTLNSVSLVRAIDKKTFDAISRQTREQASHEVPPAEFGLDIEQDLLCAVTGVPSDQSLGSRLTGIDALSTSLKTELPDIPLLLQQYYKKFQETSYRENFSWVDRIAEIKDPHLVEELDERLIAALKAEEFDNLWIAVPEIIRWADVGGFKYSLARSTPLQEDINLPFFLSSLRNRSRLNINTLKHRKIHCLSSGDYIIDKWPVYRCVYFEVEHNNIAYLLNGGKWYKVESRFVDQINQYVQDIPTASIRLPSYSDQSETAYIQRVYDGNKETFALMDNKLISHGGGHSKIEFCDLFANTNKIIHIKRYGGSHVLSHLFAQGLTSGELFLMDPEFRGKLNMILPHSHKINRTTESPSASSYEVVFAIISQQENGLSLPLFSRISLRHTIRRLKAYGYNASLLKIQAPPPPTQTRLRFQ